MKKSLERRLVEVAAWVVPSVILVAILPVIAIVAAIGGLVTGIAWVTRWAVRTDRAERIRAEFELIVGGPG